MPDLAGQIGELKMTLQIKRAATGETETVEVIGKVVEYGSEPHDVTEDNDGSHP
jgi:hypothetical protein